MGLGTIAGSAGALQVDDGGSGATPILFVHSYGGSRKHWSAQLAHVRHDHRAAAMDLRGHGGSTPPSDNDWSIEALASDIGEVADGLGFDHFVLVGHSLGAAAASAYAGTHNDRVCGLMLVGAPGKVARPVARDIMTAMSADFDKVSSDYWEKLLQNAKPHVREIVHEGMQAMGRDPGLKLIQAVFDDDPLVGLRRFHGPVLLISTPHGNSPSDLQNLMPDLPNKMMVGTSHWVQMDKPDEFNLIMDSFLARVDQGSKVSV
ncbi:MAG TPA: alpha/beta hydrolase [Candidatus Eisenbacteria bacterium]